jgi:hypothetical protein
VSASPEGANVLVTWQSVAGVTYHLLRSTRLSASPQFHVLATDLAGQAGTTTYTDTNAAHLSPLYYRVGVGEAIPWTPPSAPTLAGHFNPAARTLQLSWSGEGFRLQAQTNRLGMGGSASWFDYPGGVSSPVIVPVDPAGHAVFYRLVWP